MKRRDDEKEAEQAKKQWRVDRDEKRVEKVKEAAERALRKAQREAANKGRRKRESVGEDNMDKENVNS